MAKKVEGYIKLQIPAGKATPAPPVGDRKSTRLTPVTSAISYAVFCLKKIFFNDTATTEIYTKITLFPYTTLFPI